MIIKTLRSVKLVTCLLMEYFFWLKINLQLFFLNLLLELKFLVFCLFLTEHYFY